MRLLLHLSLIALAAAPPLQVHAQQEERDFQGQATLAVGCRYLLALPKGYEEDKTQKWPLIVFLHGAGERGDDLNVLKKHGPPKLVEQGKDLGAIVASPQAPAGSIWNPHTVKALTEELASTLRVDRDRIYLTGLSMGGYGTWETAIEYPDL